MSYTANVYRQTTNELMFKKCYFYTKMNKKMKYSKTCYQQVKYIDN